MKGFVWWTAVVVPAGATWAAIGWTFALAAVLVATTIVLIAMARSPLMAEVIRAVEAEPEARFGGRLRMVRGGLRR
jgi:hypothetical protein